MRFDLKGQEMRARPALSCFWDSASELQMRSHFDRFSTRAGHGSEHALYWIARYSSYRFCAGPFPCEHTSQTPHIRSTTSCAFIAHHFAEPSPNVLPPSGYSMKSADFVRSTPSTASFTYRSHRICAACARSAARSIRWLALLMVAFSGPQDAGTLH